MSDDGGSERNSVSAADRAYAALLDLVTSDRVRPGDQLGEEAAASWIGISRTPVRAALQRLDLEGLIRRAGRGSYVVSGLTARDVQEACDALRLLDAALFHRAADRLTGEQAAALLGCAAAMVTAVESGDLDAWSQTDQRFHALLHEAADHHLFAEMGAAQRRRLHRFWTSSASRQGRLATCAAEHADIAEAVQGRDFAGIERLVAAHVDHMEASLLRSLEDARPFLPAENSVFADA